MDAVCLERVSRFFGSGNKRIRALDDLTCKIGVGARLALVGPSGSGKTTLLSLIAALDRPDRGKIVVFDQDLAVMNETARADFRRRQVGLVFQDDALMPELTIAENLALPLVLLKTGARETEERVSDALAELGLAGYARSFPPALSGGEKQRVAVARAVIHHPRLLLADEPTANLDSQAAELVLSTIERLAGLYDLTVLMATHDPRVYERLPARLKLVDGRLPEADDQ